MELDITDFFLGCDNPQQYSASVIEYGNRVGAITRENACRDGKAQPLVNSEKEVAAVRRYFKGFGAWSEGEITAWPLEELNATLIQDIAGAMREGGLDSDATQEDWDEYELLTRDGQVSGNLFKADDGRIYYNIEG